MAEVRSARTGRSTINFLYSAASPNLGGEGTNTHSTEASIYFRVLTLASASRAQILLYTRNAAKMSMRAAALAEITTIQR